MVAFGPWQRDRLQLHPGSTLAGRRHRGSRLALGRGRLPRGRRRAGRRHRAAHLGLAGISGRSCADVPTPVTPNASDPSGRSSAKTKTPYPPGASSAGRATGSASQRSAAPGSMTASGLATSLPQASVTIARTFCPTDNPVSASRHRHARAGRHAGVAPIRRAVGTEAESQGYLTQGRAGGAVGAGVPVGGKYRCTVRVACCAASWSSSPASRARSAHGITGRPRAAARNADR